MHEETSDAAIRKRPKARLPLANAGHDHDILSEHDTVRLWYGDVFLFWLLTIDFWEATGRFGWLVGWVVGWWLEGWWMGG